MWRLNLRVAATDGDLGLSPILGVIAGAALTLLAVIFVIVVKVRRSRSVPPARTHDVTVAKHAATHHSVAMVALGTKDIAQGREMPDEKDPDIIPAKYGKMSYWLNL